MSPLMMFGAGAVAVAVAAPVTGLFVPNVYEVRTRAASVNERELRLALVMGAAVAVGVGLVASAATRNSAPLVGALLGAGLVAGVYEWALRYPAGE